MADRTAWKLAFENGWWSAFGKKRGKNSHPGPAVHDDLCTLVDEQGRTRHESGANRPNELWLTDITEHATGEGKLYLCAAWDVFSNRIVGYSIGWRMKARLAVDALNNAVRMRGNVAGCIVHSDRGSQFRSKKYCKALAQHNLVGSMGRVAPLAGTTRRWRFFFSPCPKERPQPAHMGHEGPAEDRDRHLD